MALTKHTWLYPDLLRAVKGKHSSALGFSRGDLNISASAVPNNKDTFTIKRNEKLQHIKLFKQSNNIWKWSFFGHNKWGAKRQGHRNLEFHIVHLLESAPQTQTATAHLQTTWTVYFDGQGTQILYVTRGGGGGGGGVIGWLMVGLFCLLAILDTFTSFWQRLLLEWPGSFTCYCCNTEVEWIPKQESAQKVDMEKKMLLPLLPGPEPETFRTHSAFYDLAIPAPQGFIRNTVVPHCRNRKHLPIE